MSESVLDRWFVIIVLAVILIIVTPLLVVLVILQLPSWLALVATISIIVLWGVVSGYKDWIMSRRRESEEQVKSEERKS
ncbi:hypothetical protein MUP01_03560 [Candidatus Bathyarchaeota archaeon]|nr:hypothetical protein [Candidatus Bathyarchaeota archaeon]